FPGPLMDAGELPGAKEVPLATLAVDLDEGCAVRGELFERVDAGLDMTMRNLRRAGGLVEPFDQAGIAHPGVVLGQFRSGVAVVDRGGLLPARPPGAEDDFC